MMFRRLLLIPLLFLSSVSALAEISPDWVLVFEDTFKEGRLNTKKWSRIPYEEGVSHIAWRHYQSQDDKLFRFTARGLQLRGEYGLHRTQSNPESEQQTYACAGIWSRDTFSFRYGKVEVKARFDNVQGCWPAIWLMPTGGEAWPRSGEIDLMEHLNNDEGVYQTLHFCLEDGRNSAHTNHRRFAEYGLPDQQAWHTYGMEWTPAGITFTIDNIPTATLTPEQTNRTFGDGCKSFHLIIDQQIGGSWVENSGKGGIDRDTLSRKGAALEVAYVRVWSTPEFRHRTVSAKHSESGPKPKAAAAAKAPKKKKGR